MVSLTTWVIIDIYLVKASCRVAICHTTDHFPRQISALALALALDFDVRSKKFLVILREVSDLLEIMFNPLPKVAII